MPDNFDDALDRLDIGAGDLTEFGSVRELLQARLGVAPSGLQVQIAEDDIATLTGLAASIGATIERRALREGQRLVTRSSLRDARGRIVARGAARVRQFLIEEIGF